MPPKKGKKPKARKGLNSWESVVGYLAGLFYNDPLFRARCNEVYGGTSVYTPYERDDNGVVTSGHWTFIDSCGYKEYNSIELGHQAYRHEDDNVDVFCCMYAMYYQMVREYNLPRLSGNFGKNLGLFAVMVKAQLQDQRFLDICHEIFVVLRQEDESVKDIIYDLEICIYYLEKGPKRFDFVPSGISDWRSESDPPVPPSRTEAYYARRAREESSGGYGGNRISEEDRLRNERAYERRRNASYREEEERMSRYRRQREADEERHRFEASDYIDAMADEENAYADAYAESAAPSMLGRRGRNDDDVDGNVAVRRRFSND